VKVGVVQYGNGNVHAVMRALNRCGVQPLLVDSPLLVDQCDKLIFPGVGHFKNAMETLQSGNWIDTLRKFALEDHKPFLGICLGMQLLCDWSEEGDVSGLGWIHGKVIRMQKGESQIKIPHMGWNQLSYRNGTILRNVTQEDFFYFTHSYHWSEVATDEILCKTIYGAEVITGVKKGNVWGVQFHPEKSYESGNKVIQSFLQIA
jgi:glutamine amidotransferase